MPTAILIGFEYTFNSLPGAVIDLYHAHKWCKTFGCQPNIITDMQYIKDIDNLRSVVDRKIADEDILTFYDIVFKTIVNDKPSLLTTIASILKIGIPDNKLIIYYTGHGVKDSMVMPNRGLLSFIDFRDNILGSLSYKYVEIFWILDCCNPNGLHLPYKLKNNMFELSSYKVQCVSNPILLITSSESNEKSIATKAGSVFSRHLFRLLTILNRDGDPIIRKRMVTVPTYKNRNLRRLIGNLSSLIRKMYTGYNQTVSIYSSYVIDPILWMWIGSNKDYDIVTDITLSTLIIRPNLKMHNIPVKKVILSIDYDSETSGKNDNSVNQNINPYDLIYPES